MPHQPCAMLVFMWLDFVSVNSIEQVFSKLKALLRRAHARTAEALWKQIGHLLEQFTPEQCRIYLHHCSYC